MFPEFDLSLDVLRTLGDLKRFPLTAKSDLRDAYPFRMLAVPRERRVRVRASHERKKGHAEFASARSPVLLR